MSDRDRSPSSRSAVPVPLSGSSRWIPQLDREERRELFERIEIGACGGPDFVIMMFLSTSLAAMGLLEGATAVVIGAMLVAPLMGPLVGGGLALIQANLELFRRSMGVLTMGVALGLGVSLLLGAINPGFEPTLEMEARGRPDLFDLAIAFFSGVAGAYALARPNVAATMAGVAIAAALVPPLAVIGVAFVDGHVYLAGAASILLATNLVAIVLGSAFMFRLMGVHEARKGGAVPSWARRALMLLMLAIVLLMAPLLLNALQKSREGQARPLNYPVAPDVRDAVRSFVAEHPGVEVLLMSRDGVEPETGIRLILSCPGAVEPDFEETLRQRVRVARGEPDITVQVHLLVAAPRTG